MSKTEIIGYWNEGENPYEGDQTLEELINYEIYGLENDDTISLINYDLGLSEDTDLSGIIDYVGKKLDVDEVYGIWLYNTVKDSEQQSTKEMVVEDRIIRLVIPISEVTPVLKYEDRTLYAIAKPGSKYFPNYPTKHRKDHDELYLNHLVRLTINTDDIVLCDADHPYENFLEMVDIFNRYLNDDRKVTFNAYDIFDNNYGLQI